MGYETSLHLINIKIKRDSLESVARTLKTGKTRGFSDLEYFFEYAAVDSDGYLAFKVNDNYECRYEPDEDDGTVPALEGKWYEAERIADWVKKHSEKGGSIIQHSCEGDGAAWGWSAGNRRWTGRSRPATRK